MGWKGNGEPTHGWGQARASFPPNRRFAASGDGVTAWGSPSGRRVATQSGQRGAQSAGSRLIVVAQDQEVVQDANFLGHHVLRDPIAMGGFDRVNVIWTVHYLWAFDGGAHRPPKPATVPE